MPNAHELHALKRLLKFSMLLQSDLITPDGICQVLGMGLFPNEVCENAIFEVSQESTCEATGSFGPHLGPRAKHLVFPLDQNSPVGAAIILEKTLWIASNKQLGAEFPEMISLPNFELIQTVIAVPIVLLGSVIGCLVIACKERESTPNRVAGLELIVSLIAKQFIRDRNSPAIKNSSKGTLRGLPLTDRERLIQEMMSQGLSNKECSINLGYSESTIRQDAVSMFAKLHVTNRKQAGKLF